VIDKLAAAQLEIDNKESLQAEYMAAIEAQLQKAADEAVAVAVEKAQFAQVFRRVNDSIPVVAGVELMRKQQEYIRRQSLLDMVKKAKENPELYPLFMYKECSHKELEAVLAGMSAPI